MAANRIIIRWGRKIRLVLLGMVLAACSTKSQQGVDAQGDKDFEKEAEDFVGKDDGDGADSEAKSNNTASDDDENANFANEDGNLSTADTKGESAGGHKADSENGEPVDKNSALASNNAAAAEKANANHQLDDDELPQLISDEKSNLQNFSGADSGATDVGLPGDNGTPSDTTNLSQNHVANEVPDPAEAGTGGVPTPAPALDSTAVANDSSPKAANQPVMPPALKVVEPTPPPAPPANSAPVQPPMAKSMQPMTPATAKEPEISSGDRPAIDVLPAQARLMWVGYDFHEKDRRLKIEMITEGEPQFDVFMEKNKADQPELVVRFLASDIRPKLRRDINASEFRSPVAYVRMRSDEVDHHVDVVLTMRDAVRPTLFAKNGSILLTYKIPDHYFAPAPTKVVQTVDQAQPLGAQVNLMPLMEDGSLKPKKAKLTKAFVPDPAKRVFAGVAKEGIPVEQLMSGDDSEISQEGLPPSFGHFPQDDRSSVSDRERSSFIPQKEDFFKGIVVQDFSIGAVAQDGGVAEDAPIDTEGVETPVLTQDEMSTGSKDVIGRDNEEAPGQFSGRAVQLAFHETPLNLVLKAIEEESGNNFIYPQEVGNILISVNMKDIPWDEALKGVLETYGLAMVRVGSRLTRIDRLENMNSYLERLERVKDFKTRLIPTKILVMRLSHSVAADVVPQMQTMLGADVTRDPRIKIAADPRTNSIVAEAPPYVLAKIKNTVERIDLETPQVEIASRIVEVKRDASNFFGILWGSGVNFDPTRGLGFGTLNFPNSVNSTFSVDPGVNAANAAGNMALRFGSLNNFVDIDLLFKMEEKKGNTNVLQHDHVTVLDRQAAKIEAGSSQFFRPAAGGAVIQAGGGGAAGGAAGGGNAGLAQVDFVLSLEVTPEVSASGTVNMNIKINSDTPGSTLGEVLANKNTRHVETKMSKKSGETGVIGGIYDTKQTKTTVGIPYLSDIPILGALFRSTSTDESQMELLVMVTPTVLSGEDGKNRKSEGGAAGTVPASTPSEQTPNENNGVYENPSAAGNNGGSNGTLNDAGNNANTSNTTNTANSGAKSNTAGM